MNKITEKNIKQIRKGNHAVLMDCLDFLLDTYDENKWDLGYKACLSDLSVRSQRLAEHICKTPGEKGRDKNGKPLSYLNEDDLAKVIEDYYTKALKQE